MEKSVKISLIVSLSVIIVVSLIIFAVLELKNLQEKNTISSIGEAEISVVPDLVSLYLNIETKGNNSKEANEKNSKIYDELIKNLESVGLKKEEIKTISFNIFEEFDWTQQGRKSLGWKAIHSLEIKINSSEGQKISKVIDESINSGANIGWINFELSKELEIRYKTEAIKIASQDARARAEALISGQKKKLGKLISIEENFEYYPWRVFDASAEISSELVSKQAKESISPSERKIYARVKAVYEIKD